ncbi:hypothetical protein [Ideonella sp. YS5]|uniref:hypothetical protein n=1 Tax=Ideonella sp. YS5 TaxID=3453714 RepID=UPI003EF02C8A
MIRPARLLLFAALAIGGSALAAPLHLAAPQPGQVIHESDGHVGVVVADLPAGARLQALLDGAPIGQVQEAPAFELADVPRGVHRLRVILLDDQGRELASSEDVEFTLWRASVRLRPRAPPRP